MRNFINFLKGPGFFWRWKYDRWLLRYCVWCSSCSRYRTVRNSKHVLYLLLIFYILFCSKFHQSLQIKSFRIPNPISVDESKPKTKIQIRMQGGQKIVQEFNHDHLVADLFMFIGSKVNKEIFTKIWSRYYWLVPVVSEPKYKFSRTDSKQILSWKEIIPRNRFSMMGKQLKTLVYSMQMWYKCL